LELVLANAAQVKNVPGRKSDIRALAKLRSHHRHRPGRDVFSRRESPAHQPTILPLSASRACTVAATSLATSGRLGSSRTKLIIPVLGTPRARTGTPCPLRKPQNS